MKKTVWVIEDDPGIGEIVSLVLDDDGHIVRLFNNVASFELALASEDERPDLFLFDVMLPDGNGLHLCDMVKGDEYMNSLPVMMMSAHVSFAKVQLSCSADAFIAKPFDIDILSAKVNQLLS